MEEISDDFDLGTKEVEVTRRQAFTLIPAFAALILAACKGDVPKETLKPVVDKSPIPTSVDNPVTSEIAKTATQIEIPRDKSVKLPEFTKSEKPVTFVQPEGLYMSEAEFMALSLSITHNIRIGVESFLVPRLRPNADNNALIQDFIAQVAQMISSSTPQAKGAMDLFVSKWEDRNSNDLITQLNKFLNPSGLYLEVRELDGGILEIQVYEIVGSEYMSVKDNKGQIDVPVLKLKKMITMPSADSTDEGGLATCDPDFSKALIFHEKSTTVAGRIRRSLLDFPNYKFSMSERDFDGAVYSDFLQHESTHVFLAQRFPEIGNKLDKDFFFMVPLEIQFNDGEGTKIPLNGGYPPVMFQELCGVGMQIAKTSTGTPYSISMYFSDDENLMRGGYHLVSQIMPLAVLEVAPDCSLKREILKGLTHPNPGEPGVIDYDKLRQLVGNPPFTQEHARKVGEVLYQLGYTLLQKAKNGDFRAVIDKSQ